MVVAVGVLLFICFTVVVEFVKVAELVVLVVTVRVVVIVVVVVMVVVIVVVVAVVVVVVVVEVVVVVVVVVVAEATTSQSNPVLAEASLFVLKRTLKVLSTEKAGEVVLQYLEPVLPRLPVPSS